MPGSARERWGILAKVIRRHQEEGTMPGTKRTFHNYSLLTWGEEGAGGWRRVGHGGVEAEVRLAPTTSPSLTELIGFNNTGNVCVWPSEECLAVYCLARREELAGLRVLEVGGGMAAIAGLLLAATGLPAAVTLTDGNATSVDSLEAVVKQVSESTKTASPLTAGLLRWDDAAQVEARRGQFDLILSADCVFFGSQLAPAMAAMLAPGGEALVMAPGREGTLDTFHAEAGRHFGAVEEVERYSPQVWKAHEACVDLQDYTEDIHYPRLLRCTL